MIKGGFIQILLLICLFTNLTSFSQTCIDRFLVELTESKHMPKIQGLCYDEAAFSKFWKSGTKFAKASTTFWKAKYCYRQAAQFGFKFAWFNLEYASFLVKTGKLNEALIILNQIPTSDPLYANGQLKIAEIMIWTGEYKGSSRLLQGIKSEPRTQIEESKKNLLRLCDSLSAPVVKIESFYNSDNQPLSHWGQNVTFRHGISKAFNYQIQAGNSFFLKDIKTVQTRIGLQNNVYFSNLNTSLSLGIGGVMFGNSGVKRTYLFGVRTQFNRNLLNELKIESKVYDLTRGSVGSVLLVDQLTENVRYNRSSGFSFEIFGSYSKLNKSTTNQYNLYGWFLSPYLVRGLVKPRVGAFLGYSNSNKILYSSVLSYEELVNSGNIQNIEGVFSTWFTPNQMKVVGGIADVQYQPFRNLQFNATNTVGIGFSNEPYLFLSDDEIGLSSYKTFFVPLDLKINTTFTPTRTIEIKCSYEYRITVFNKAHLVNLSISKRL